MRDTTRSRALKPESAKAAPPPDRNSNGARYIGHDYLKPDGSWHLDEFRILEPVPLPAVDDILKHAVPTEEQKTKTAQDLPCGAAIRLTATAPVAQDGAGAAAPDHYANMTFLHRMAADNFQLIRRLATNCAGCGGERVMYLYPDGTAVCGVCEMRRD